LTLPGAGLVGGMAALLADRGTVGVVALLALLTATCAVIWVISRRHRIHSGNVTESAEVIVLGSTAAVIYPDDPRLAVPEKTRHRAKAKGAA
jgi:PiT family inorganic phosphate transporter